MEIGDGQAEPAADLVTSVWREHHDRRRPEREVVGEAQLAVVEAAVVWRVGRALQDVVPLLQVVLERRGLDERRRVEVRRLLSQAREARAVRHEMGAGLELRGRHATISRPRRRVHVARRGERPRQAPYT